MNERKLSRVLNEIGSSLIRISVVLDEEEAPASEVATPPAPTVPVPKPEPTPPEPEPEPEPEKDKKESQRGKVRSFDGVYDKFRSWIQEQTETFTRRQAADAMGMRNVSSISPYIEKAVKTRFIKEAGRKERDGSIGQPPKLYAYTGKKRTTAEERQKQLRDWVVANYIDGGTFTMQDAENALHLGRNGAVPYMKSALRSGLIEKVSEGNPGVAAQFAYKTRPAGPTSRPTFREDTRKIAEDAAKTAPIPRSTGQAVQRTRHPDKEVQKLLEPAIRGGAVLEQTGGGHFRLSQRGKQPVIIASSTSDRRARKNMVTSMRRYGYPVS